MTYIPKVGERVRVTRIADLTPTVSVGDIITVYACSGRVFDTVLVQTSSEDAGTYCEVEPWPEAVEQPSALADPVAAAARLAEARGRRECPAVDEAACAVVDESMRGVHKPYFYERRGERNPMYVPSKQCCTPLPPVFMSTDAATRKRQPLGTGVLAYFPDALALVAYVSRVGNDQHNPGQPLHWAKEKSRDEVDAMTRHLCDWFKGASVDAALSELGQLAHLAQAAWRSLALLQREADRVRAKLDGRDKPDWDT